jgi:hypothetical protein
LYFPNIKTPQELQMYEKEFPPNISQVYSLDEMPTEIPSCHI